MLIRIAPVFLGAFLSWFKKARPLSVLLLIVGYAAALVSGFVQPIGIAGVIVVALLAWLCNQTLNGVRGVALHIIFLCLGRITVFCMYYRVFEIRSSWGRSLSRQTQFLSRCISISTKPRLGSP